MKISIGCTRAGLDLKDAVIPLLEERGHEVTDLGMRRDGYNPVSDVRIGPTHKRTPAERPDARTGAAESPPGSLSDGHYCPVVTRSNKVSYEKTCHGVAPGPLPGGNTRHTPYDQRRLPRT